MPEGSAHLFELHGGLGHRGAHGHQGERKEQDGIAHDEQGGALVEVRNRADSEEDQRQGDDQAGEGLDDEGAPLQEHGGLAWVTHREQGHGDGEHRGQRSGGGGVPGGVQRRADEGGGGGQGGVPRIEQPVDDDADGQSEGEPAQQGERGQHGDRAPAQAERPALASHLWSHAAHPAAAPGGQVAAEDGEAQEDEDQGEAAGRGQVVDALGLEEDLGGEGVVAKDLERAVLGQEGQGHQHAPPEERGSGLAQRHPPEGAGAAQAQAVSDLFLAGISAPKGGSNGQVDERVERQGHDQEGAQESLDGWGHRHPSIAGHEVGNGQGHHDQDGPDPTTGQVGTFDAPGGGDADDRGRRGHGQRQSNRVPQQVQGQLAEQQVEDGRPAALGRLDK